MLGYGQLKYNVLQIESIPYLQLNGFKEIMFQVVFLKKGIINEI